MSRVYYKLYYEKDGILFNHVTWETFSTKEAAETYAKTFLEKDCKYCIVEEAAY